MTLCLSNKSLDVSPAPRMNPLHFNVSMIVPLALPSGQTVHVVSVMTTAASGGALTTLHPVC